MSIRQIFTLACTRQFTGQLPSFDWTSDDHHDQPRTWRTHARVDYLILSEPSSEEGQILLHERQGDVLFEVYSQAYAVEARSHQLFSQR